MSEMHPFSFGFGGDLDMAGYYDSLPEAVKRELCFHLDQFHSVDDLKAYVEKLDFHEKNV
ncbi:hypothetical protein [Zongyangia hominis]|uniref:Uncharacterized protein n=1 Tax=Zongyangia hominis TaxID=2763677 RepID=A0A926EDE9_9FIRM|nr:hypothetical protein [Zongyangia hominis]MBC8569876.1 hypothetical protein [Zongyangia hominis]